ncbi:CAZyme family GH18 and CBM24 [Trichoderma harzianum]|nr:CAZyme family GH18 and CBM24 [Trichoderma harzianum]
MWLAKRSAAVFILWGTGFVRSAINIDGSQAVEPVSEDDPSPIADINTYYPDRYDCPLPCIDLANTHTWTPYLSVDRLKRCNEPMLLQLSITQPLDDPISNILIRSCTLGSQETPSFKSTVSSIQNPKKGKNLFRGGSLKNSPACAITGFEVDDKLVLAKSSSGKGNGREIASLLESMSEYFEAKDNCDENFLFAYHKETVASVYIGAGLGKPTVSSALKSLAASVHDSNSISSHTVAQLCGSGRLSTRTFGVSVDTTGDLAAVQKTALGWSNGICASKGDLITAGNLAGVKVLDIGGNNSTFNSEKSSLTSRAASWISQRDKHARNMLDERATCRYIQVVPGDSCGALASRCGISPADFTKYNPSPTLCSTLQPGDYVCCSSGTPFVPPKPKPNPDGTCATHLIVNGDSCDALAKVNNITTAEIESFNKGKTWAWTACKDMLVGYNMCLSTGRAPIPPPQAGAECGPLVAGTKLPADNTTSLADLNPCPLKACCSNWGFCGVFPAHCDVHAPSGGGPGTKEPGYQNTCVSNCGNKIKSNSGPPATFQRIGYYEAFGLDRDCLWLKAKNANTDGTYTHIHWGFATIDSSTWKLKINDTKGQWADFKKLPNVKKIVSIGGWAYSTEAATYNIIRQAIITNKNAFTTNLAQFVKDEGIDGIDIDWEYPGAPDILVGGQPIGQKNDGADYLSFLTLLKQKLGSGKSVSIAAPASYWYLKAFPIDRISAVIDYIVYMTYDLHGQWDYGNANAFDMCPSVNITETRNSLAMLTKAGVANNKIFVGEASYGRSFHMATDGCWGPMCDFTGTRLQSDAKPGRCTKAPGYVAYAEINEIIKKGDGAQTFRDNSSDSDIMLYKGDYVSYMTTATKDTRRNEWKGLNFAGSIDWAVDLQSFTTDDLDAPPTTPKPGDTGCVSGEDNSINSGDLCEFSCGHGFCPESLCTCVTTGMTTNLPSASELEVMAWDIWDVDLNRLCKFSCKYGYCPQDICTDIPKEDEGEEEPDTGYFNYTDARWQNAQHCLLFKDPQYRDVSVNQCKPVCQAALDDAEKEGRTSNYGCIGNFPVDKEIPWEKYPGASYEVAPGQCLCDNMLINEIADFVLDALPIIAQIGCYILMSSLKLVLEVGLEFIPGVGKPLDAGLDMALTATEMVNYIYPEGEDPGGAFEWWLSPCGGSGLVPDDIKNIFDTLSQVAGGVSSFKPPKNIPKGSGKKGDDGNPTDRGKPRPNTGGSGKGTPAKKQCKVPPSKQTQRLGQGKNTLRIQSCVGDKTKTTEIVVTSLDYAANAKPTQVAKACDAAWSQACYHYSSAIRVNPQWATLTCPQEAAATKHRLDARATSVWSSQHAGEGWQDRNAPGRTWQNCDRDEYPPAYLLGETDPAYINSGSNSKGQLVRYVPNTQNQKAGQMWKGTCFGTPVKALSDKVLMDSVAKAPQSKKQNIQKVNFEQTMAEIGVDVRPEFTISSWGPPSSSDAGLSANPCWPKGIAAADPGFALLTYDPYYGGRAPAYDYKAKYVKGSNGS